MADWIGVDVANLAGLTVPERLARHTHAEPPPPYVPPELGDCMIWHGNRDKWGYGVIALNGKRMMVHRAAWIDRHGMPHPGVPCVLHRCDNPPCCNVEHLFLGTVADNNADMTAKGRNGGAHRKPGRRGTRHRDAIGPLYPCGHPRTDENSRVSVSARTGYISRACRICALDAGRRWKARQREKQG